MTYRQAAKGLSPPNLIYHSTHIPNKKNMLNTVAAPPPPPAAAAGVSSSHLQTAPPDHHSKYEKEEDTYDAEEAEFYNHQAIDDREDHTHGILGFISSSKTESNGNNKNRNTLLVKQRHHKIPKQIISQEIRKINMLKKQLKVRGGFEAEPDYSSPEYALPHRDDDLTDQESNLRQVRGGGLGSLMNAKLYKKYSNHNLDVLASPLSLSRWASETGIINLVDRNVIPPHLDVSPALKGRHGDKKYLRPIKARLFPISLKSERGTIWEQPRRVYMPALKLEKSILAAGREMDEWNRRQKSESSPKMELPPILRADEFISNERLLASRNRIGVRGDVTSNSDVFTSMTPTVEEENHSVAKMSMQTQESKLESKDTPGWVIYMQDGSLQDQTDSYKRFFERICELNIQPASSWLLEDLRKLATAYNIPLIIIDCEKVIEKCQGVLLYPFRHNQLLECVFNIEKITKLMRKPGQLFHNGDQGTRHAAQTLLFHYKQAQNRVQRRQEALNARAIVLIRQFCHAWKCRKSFFKTIQTRMIQEKESFNTIQELFLLKQSDLIIENRVIVIICPPERFQEPYNHMERAYFVQSNPNLTIILVLHTKPFHLEDQIDKVFDVEHKGHPIELKKLHVIVTDEVSPSLSLHSPPGASLYLSIKAMKEVKEICQGKEPIVIADYLSPYIECICAQLNSAFFGPPAALSKKLHSDPLKISEWLVENGIPLMPCILMSRSATEEEIREKGTTIMQSNPNTKKWMFRRFDRFGNKFINVFVIGKIGRPPKDCGAQTEENIWAFWVFGGILDGLPPVPNYKLIQVGIQLDPHTWHLVATTESNIINYEEFGLTIPQQTIPAFMFRETIEKMTSCLKANQFIGYLSILFYAWEDPESQEFVLKVSSIVPYLNRAILKAITMTTKTRLVIDMETFELELDNKVTPWELPYLSKSSNADLLMINKNFKAKMMEKTMKNVDRVLFCFDKIHHDIVTHLTGRLVAVHLQRQGLTFDSWLTIGVEFPPSKTKFPVICVEKSLEDALELFLGVLAFLEQFSNESEFPFQNNLHKVAVIVLEQLQQLRRKNGHPNTLDVDRKQFEIAFEPLYKCVKPYVKLHLLPPQAAAPEIVPIQAPGPSSLTIKLVQEEIASVIAFEKDPSLRGAVAIPRTPKAVSSGTLSRKEEENAQLLLDKIDYLLFSPNRDDQSYLLDTKWNVLLPKHSDT